MATTPDDPAIFQELLTAYSGLPRDKVERTFMQISGYPHYENVCSNILAFFLDPENEHGFSDLLLRALFKALSIDTGEHFASAEVDREVPMADGGRLDLLIATDGYIIGIENKIYHHLENDLGAYAKSINAKAARDARVPVRIVLGLSDYTELLEDSAGFVSLTYAQWFEAVRALTPHYETGAHPKYRTYLSDFIRTLAELQGGTVTNMATEAFFEQNADDIERLADQYKKYKHGLAEKHIPPLVSRLADLNDRPHVTQWVWSRYDLVHDFEYQGTKFALDAMVLPGGWQVLFWPRTKRAHGDIFERVLGDVWTDGPVERTKNNGRPIVGRFPLSTSHDVIAATLREMVTTIADRLDALRFG